MATYPEVLVTPDTPTIKFNTPREQVDLDKELPRILHAQGWGCGTYFNVQFLNHEKTKVISCARFVVVEVSESAETSDANPYQPITKTVFTRQAEQIGDWWTKQSVPVLDYSAGLVAGPQMSAREVTERFAEHSEVSAAPARRGRPPKAA